MFETTVDNLSTHLSDDMGIENEDLVFLFSGIFGLGKLSEGLLTIEKALENVLSKGTVIVPTFSYSWSNGEPFNKQTPCPEMGSFSNFILDLPNYYRTHNPNFSVSIRKNKFNEDLVNEFLDIGDDCFGKKSIFDKVVNYSKNKRAFILLLGGAFNDAEYRSTFIHYAQQKIGVPHRYVKPFYSPEGGERKITQLVRCLNEKELLENKKNIDPKHFNYPIEEDYSLYGKDLENAGILTKRDFGYYPSRMVSVKESVNFYMEKIKNNPFYCIHKDSLVL